MKPIALALCLLVPGTAFSDIYKWTDKDGQVHYGEKPGGKTSQKVAVPKKKSKPKAAHANEKTRLENTKKWVAARQREREQKKQRQAKLKKERAETKKYCDGLRNEITDMDQGGIAWYRLDGNGERQYYSEEDIENEKKEMRETFKKNCR